MNRNNINMAQQEKKKSINIKNWIPHYSFHFSFLVNRRNVLIFLWKRSLWAAIMWYTWSTCVVYSSSCDYPARRGLEHNCAVYRNIFCIVCATNDTLLVKVKCMLYMLYQLSACFSFNGKINCICKLGRCILYNINTNDNNKQGKHLYPLQQRENVLFAIAIF